MALSRARRIRQLTRKRRPPSLGDRLLTKGLDLAADVRHHERLNADFLPKDLFTIENLQRELANSRDLVPADLQQVSARLREAVERVGAALSDEMASSPRSTWSIRSTYSALSAHSALSFASVGSLLSAGSILSIGSAGSILSIGSAGSILSIGSSGSILAIGATSTNHAAGGASSTATATAATMFIERSATVAAIAALAAAAISA